MIIIPARIVIHPESKIALVEWDVVEPRGTADDVIATYAAQIPWTGYLLPVDPFHRS